MKHNVRIVVESMHICYTDGIELGKIYALSSLVAMDGKSLRYACPNTRRLLNIALRIQAHHAELDGIARSLGGCAYRKVLSIDIIEGPLEGVRIYEY